MGCNYLVLPRNQRGLLAVFSVLILLCVLGLAGCSYGRTKAKTVPNSNNLVAMKILSPMFPEQTFRKQENYYVTDDGKTYYIESILSGTFVHEGRDEILVTVRRPKDELSHAEGFYNAYLAVFDQFSGELVSSVKKFSADEGSLHIFAGQARSYIFFAGNTTYQGWTEWQGGLWQAGTQWTMKWPQPLENKAYYDFWQNRAVEIAEDGITLLARKLLPPKNPNQTMPDYTWESAEKLMWDKQSESFLLRGAGHR